MKQKPKLTLQMVYRSGKKKITVCNASSLHVIQLGNIVQLSVEWRIEYGKKEIILEHVESGAIITISRPFLDTFQVRMTPAPAQL